MYDCACAISFSTSEEEDRKAVVYSDFTDEIGDGVEHELPQVGEAKFARFKQKARHFLKAHEDHIVLHKLRQGKPLTAMDLTELEKMLLDAGIGEAGDIERARKIQQTDSGASSARWLGSTEQTVRDAFGEFLAAGVATAEPDRVRQHGDRASDRSGRRR